MMRRTILWLLALSLTACVACGGGQPSAKTAADDRPELKPENIKDDIPGEWVRVPAADGSAKEIPWVFDPSEPRQIEIVDQKIEGDSATFLINMQTHTAPRSRDPKSLSGQLRVHYRLESGLVLRSWEIKEVENVSFKYVKETPPPDANGNANGSSGNANAAPNGNSNAKPKANENTKSNANANANS
ncbi:MAG: hypothetical protein ACJ741_15315 [Pyrinomonadaceae bacterium]